MTVRRLLPLAAVLVSAGLVLAQPPAKTGTPDPKKDAGRRRSRPSRPRAAWRTHSTRPCGTVPTSRPPRPRCATPRPS